MEKYIAVTKECREFLQKAFNTSKPTIWRALTFADRGGDSELACKIRRLAQLRGGILMVVAHAMETIHDADDFMRQYFPNGVMLECDKKTGRIDIIKDGKSVKSYADVRLDCFSAIQAEAQKL